MYTTFNHVIVGAVSKETFSKHSLSASSAFMKTKYFGLKIYFLVHMYDDETANFNARSSIRLALEGY